MKNDYAIFFCLAITLHNLEEALWLTKWFQMGSPIQQLVTTNVFYFAVCVITGLAYIVAFLYVTFPKIHIIRWVFIGFLGSMVFNAFFPHLLATIITKTYAPGLVTGVLLNIPINTFILYQLHRLKIINIKEIIASTVVVGIFLLTLIPLLFVLGDHLNIFS